jgi:hypothetical protein
MCVYVRALVAVFGNVLRVLPQGKSEDIHQYVHEILIGQFFLI